MRCGEDGGAKGVALDALGFEILDEEEEGDDALRVGEELGEGGGLRCG